MGRVWWDVAPRYTPGSPAMVPRETALRVAEQERRAYEQTLTGAYGEEEKRRAESMELRGIVWTWHQRGSHILWRDELTGDTGTIKLRKGESIRWPWKESR